VTAGELPACAFVIDDKDDPATEDMTPERRS
jgi:hypothetical protein